MSASQPPGTLEVSGAPSLFSPLELPSGLVLPNRVVFLPMTRCFAGPGLVPTADMTAYYARRSSAGLLISEATLVAADAQGYPRTPGIFSAAQVAGWRAVTEAVHAQGGRIFCQLWHTGRLSHSCFTGVQPMGPSSVTAPGKVPRTRRLAYEEPREMGADDILRVQAEFVRAAQAARAAGFDGVEVHGANGYLIDQFLHHATNLRTDAYGGDAQGMCRFALELMDELTAALGTFPVGLRLSPSTHVNLSADPRDRGVFDVLLDALSTRPLEYVNLGHFDDQTSDPLLGARPSHYLRGRYPGRLIVAGGYTSRTAQRALSEGQADLVGFGRAFLANPDLIARLLGGRELAVYRPELLSSLDGQLSGG